MPPLPVSLPPPPPLVRQRRVTVYFGGRRLANGYAYGELGDGTLMRGPDVGSLATVVTDPAERRTVAALQDEDDGRVRVPSTSLHSLEERRER